MLDLCSLPGTTATRSRTLGSSLAAAVSSVLAPSSLTRPVAVALLVLLDLCSRSGATRSLSAVCVRAHFDFILHTDAPISQTRRSPSLLYSAPNTHDPCAYGDDGTSALSYCFARLADARCARRIDVFRIYVGGYVHCAPTAIRPVLVPREPRVRSRALAGRPARPAVVHLAARAAAASLADARNLRDRLRVSSVRGHCTRGAYAFRCARSRSAPARCACLVWRRTVKAVRPLPALLARSAERSVRC